MSNIHVVNPFTKTEECSRELWTEYIRKTCFTSIYRTSMTVITCDFKSQDSWLKQLNQLKKATRKRVSHV